VNPRTPASAPRVIGTNGSIPPSRPLDSMQPNSTYNSAGTPGPTAIDADVGAEGYYTAGPAAPYMPGMAMASKAPAPDHKPNHAALAIPVGAAVGGAR
jgi:hypothetical protein